jgi:hypothetical protein
MRSAAIAGRSGLRRLRRIRFRLAVPQIAWPYPARNAAASGGRGDRVRGYEKTETSDIDQVGVRQSSRGCRRIRLDHDREFIRNVEYNRA